MEHLSVEERIERGRAARAHAPRRSHAGFSPPADRPDPVALLERQAVSRVQELVPIRYGRLLVSPFAFYRGAALIMASDLARTPASGLRAQICGDAHLSNFGVFGTPERRLVFDLNDFDETLPGPWEWDLKRLAASLAVAGRENGFPPDARRTIIVECVRRYRRAMARFAAGTNLDVFYSGLDADRFMASYRATLPKRAAARTEASLAKARTRDSMHALRRLSHSVGGERRIIHDPPLIVPASELLPAGRLEEFDEWMRARLREYRRTLETDRRALLGRYRMVDFARKVVGVGSVGTQAWVMLLVGRDERDPLFLQFKQAQPSVLEEFVGASEYRNAGHRVVAGQRVMQAAGDIFLGWLRVDGLEDGPAGLLRAPAQGLEGVGGHRGSAPQGHGHVRPEVRVDPGPRARVLGGRRRDLRLPR